MIKSCNYCADKFEVKFGKQGFFCSRECALKCLEETTIQPSKHFDKESVMAMVTKFICDVCKQDITKPFYKPNIITFKSKVFSDREVRIEVESLSGCGDTTYDLCQDCKIKLLEEFVENHAVVA